MPDAPAPRRYAAFVSYRHADNREAGRRWAEWLHQALETYAVPPELVGQPNLRGEPIPASLYPVFRDEEELPADADLSLGIRRALEASGVLVVLCSPRACTSRFVDDEIRTFKELGRGDRVLAVLIEGEPNADQVAGTEPAAPLAPECLPTALRYGVPGPDGTVDWSKRAEPIAADVRPGGGTAQGYTSAGAYGEALRRAGGRGGREIAALTKEYAQRLDLARLKVVAGVLGVPLGTLRARDAAYRARRLRRLATVLGSLALVALVAASIAVWQGHRAEANFARAEQARREQELQLIEAARYAHASAERGLRVGRWREGLSLLGRSLHYRRDDRAAAAHLWSALAYGRGDRDEPPLAVWSVGAPVEALAASRAGRALAVVTPTPELVVLDLVDGSRRRAAIPTADYPGRIRVSPDGSRVLLERHALTWFLVSWDDAGGAQVVPVPDVYLDCAFRPDGSEILAADVLHGVRRLGRDDGRLLEPDVGPPGRFVAAGLSPDLTRWIGQEKAVDGSYHVRLFAFDGAPEAAPHGLPEGEPLFPLELGPRGECVALLATGQVGVWDLAAGRRVVAPQRDAPSWRGFAFHPEGRSCAIDFASGTLEVHALPSGERLLPRVHHAAKELRAAFSADGTRIFTGGSDGTLAAWPAPSGAAVAAAPLTDVVVTQAAWLGADRVALATETRVEIWDVVARRRLAPIETGARIQTLVAAPDGSWLAVGGPGGTVGVWDPAHAAKVRDVKGPALDLYGLRGGAGGRVLMSAFDLSNGSMVQRLQVLDVVAGAAVGPVVSLERPSSYPGLSADGERIVATYGPDQPVRAWRASDGQPLERVDPADVEHVLGGDVRAGLGVLAPSAFARADDNPSVLDLETRLPHSEPLGPPKARSYWSPDGALLLVVSAEGTATLFATPHPGPPGPWLDDLVAAASGLALAEDGQARPLTPQERLDARQRLAEARPDDPSWARLLAWWLAPPGTRSAVP